jgi:hypothetical protein
MIDIATVLNLINITYDERNRPKIFSIKFVKDNGQVRHIAKAQKSVKHAKIGGGKGDKSKFKYNLKERGTILICDTAAKKKEDQYKSVKISTIIEYNGQAVFF